jgi:hypothetical protein
MVVLNVDGSVRDVEILVYREPRGWKVGSWFRVFRKDTTLYKPQSPGKPPSPSPGPKGSRQ